MDPQLIQNIPSSVMAIVGLIQFAIIIWIFLFPVIIIKKLTEIADILKERKSE